MYLSVKGAQVNTTTHGIFDLDTDSNGRWSVEKFKGLMFSLERDANAIGQQTRRGKGNMVLCSVMSHLHFKWTGIRLRTCFKQQPKRRRHNNYFAGVLNGRYRVYIDPYANMVQVSTML